MDIFGSNLFFGDFVAYNHGVMIGSFNTTMGSQESLGFTSSTQEVFVGDNPIPIYLGDNYSEKLTFTFTLIKSSSVHFNRNLSEYFSENECRAIIRNLTSKRGYQWLQIVHTNIDEEFFYNAKVNNISYEKIGGSVAGIVVDVECDSCFAWSKEYSVPIAAKANIPFYIFNNTDDLVNYIYPMCTIVPSSSGTLEILNHSDNEWTTSIKNVQSQESITMDSKNEILSSTSPSHTLILNDFNLNWIRLIPGQNKITSNMDARFTFTYRVPRKVGIV